MSTEAGNTWCACALGCHGLEGVLGGAAKKRMLAGSRVREPRVHEPCEPTCARPASEAVGVRELLRRDTR